MNQEITGNNVVCENHVSRIKIVLPSPTCLFYRLNSYSLGGEGNGTIWAQVHRIRLPSQTLWLHLRYRSLKPPHTKIRQLASSSFLLLWSTWYVCLQAVQCTTRNGYIIWHPLVLFHIDILCHYHDNHISFATLSSRLKRVRYDNNLKLNGKNILKESGWKKTITELIFATEVKRNLLCRILFYQHYFFREKMTNVSFGIRNISW